MIKDLKKIIKHFGVENQIQKTFEELDELKEAIEEGDRKHIIEELADAMIMMSQIMLIYRINPITVIKMKKKKIERTKERIENGFYAKDKK